VACSRSAEAFLAGSGYDSERVRLIPNGFDLDRFAPDPSERAAVRAELGLGDRDLVVGHVGRDHRVKDHPTLLAAASIAATRFPDLRLVLVGAGLDDANRSLAEDARSLGQRVVMLGERSDVPRLYRAFDLFALSSMASEALPLVIGEAMASGVPAVSTDCGDARELIGDTGRVVPRRDPAAFAAALEELLGLAPTDRMALGVAARERIASGYSLAGMSEAYRATWARVASRDA
jgi:glycosyltransferase involved in cell wall biosynthesis